MAFLTIRNVAMRGLALSVPKNVEENSALPFYTHPGEAEQVIRATGIERRHVVTPDLAVSDLCAAAAERLIAELGWQRESIDLLAMVTQCPDYLNHPTSFVVHERMGLAEDTACLDIFSGCPGWAVGLSGVMSMLQTGSIRRVILLDGDAVTKNENPIDRESRPLFGDAGSATALEYDEKAAPIYFNIGTKSDGGRALAKLNGGYRHPYTDETFRQEWARRQGRIAREELPDSMDSMDIFSFAITKVPKALKRLMKQFDIQPENVDKLVLHQANKLIIEAIAKRMKMPMDRVPIGLTNYGNTTSVSIPTAIVAAADDFRHGRQRSLMCGFGTGLAWGAMYIETENLVIPAVVEI